jgi:para-aminobenzoate synthetase component 1
VYCGPSAGSTPTEAQATSTWRIRTFWVEDDQLHLGTGGGITWDSEPADEWAETELKARQLLRVASGSAHV